MTLKKEESFTFPVFYLLFCLFDFGLATGFLELSSLTRDRTQAPAVEVWSPNHWTTREFLLSPILKREAISLGKLRRGWELQGCSGLRPKKDHSVQLRISCGQVTERKLSSRVKERYRAQNSLEMKLPSRSSPPFYAKQRALSPPPPQKKGH